MNEDSESPKSLCVQSTPNNLATFPPITTSGCSDKPEVWVFIGISYFEHILSKIKRANLESKPPVMPKPISFTSSFI